MPRASCSAATIKGVCTCQRKAMGGKRACGGGGFQESRENALAFCAPSRGPSENYIIAEISRWASGEQRPPGHGYLLWLRNCDVAHPTLSVSSIFVCAFQEQSARDACASAPRREMQG